MKARTVKRLDAEGPLAPAAERIVAVRLDELCSFVPHALDPAATEPLHDMRIAAKRLRYVLEVTAPVFGPYAAEAAKVAKRLQTVLGDVHDCDVVAPRIEALVAELEGTQGTVGLEAHLAELRVRREGLFGEFAALWRELERDGFRARLQDATAPRPPGTVVPEDAA